MNMKKTKIAVLFLSVALCMCLAVSLAVFPGFAETEWLGAYTSVNEELDSRDAGESTEMSLQDDSLRTFEYGFRIPTFDEDGNITSYMGGGTIDNFSPPAQRGTGITVAENTAKLKLKTIGSGSGSARYRYAYPVELNGLVVENNFSELQSDDHIALTFSKNYNAFRHATAQVNGITLIYYVEAGGDYIKINYGRNNATVLTEDSEGVGFTDVALTTVPGEEESYSVRTEFTETDTTITVTVSNGGSKGSSVTKTFNKTQVDGLEDESGRTWINISSINDSRGGDDNGYYTYFTMRVTDDLRKEYEEETLAPFKAALEEYSAEKINEATISSIEDVDAWLAKKDAVQAFSSSDLRISDRYALEPDAAIAEADAALKAKAGDVVAEYVDGLISDLKTTLAVCDSDTQFTTIRSMDAYEELMAEYESVYTAVTVAYASVNGGTPDTDYLTTAKNNLDRLYVHIRICTLEDMPLTNAAEIAEAKQAYAALNTDEFKAEIGSLVTTDEIKNALLDRLAAYADTLTEAEEGQDASDLVNVAISNYENADISDLDKIYEALDLRGLIQDYSELPEAEEFAARVAEKDAAVQVAAWGLIEDRVSTIETLAADGVESYREKAAMNKAIAAISERDLLAGEAVTLDEEDMTRYEKAVSDGETLVAAFEKQLSDNHVRTQDINAESGDDMLGDVEFTDKGLLYTFTGDQQQLMYTQAQDIYEGVTISFSVKQWAFLTGDGSGYTSNNAWVYFSDTPDSNRSHLGAISLMFWNQVSSSYVKTYYNSDLEVVQETMSTFAEDDGSYVDVMLKANDDRSRFEVSVNYKSADGTVLETCIIYMSYTDEYDASTFAGGVYVGVACFMTHAVGELYNEWYIRSIGETVFFDESTDPGTDPDDDNDPTDPGTDSDENKDPDEPGSGCSSAIGAGTAAAGALIVLAAVVSALLIRRRKEDR